MKVFVTLSALFAVSLAAQGGYGGNQQGAYRQPQQQQSYQPIGQSASNSYQVEQQKPPIPILRQESKHNEDGSYEFNYETGNGISVGEQGYIKPGGQKDEAIQVAQGYFSYTSDDGIPISLKYVADENGFQPTGDHLPTPPPLPQELIDAIEKAANDPRQNDGDDGLYHGEGAASNVRPTYQQQQQQQQKPYYKY